MGTLIEQSLKTLYQGVSRQPDSLRLTGQVQEATNVLTSVISGGLESRPASRHVSNNTFAYTADKPWCYSYVRDAVEQYIIVVKTGDLKVYNLAGVEQTVTFPNGKSYLASTNPAEGFTATTIGDITVIGNKATTVAMAETDYVSSANPSALITCRSTTTGTNALIVDNLNDKATDGIEVWSKTGAIDGSSVADNIITHASFTGFTSGFQNFTVEQKPNDHDLTVVLTNTAGHEFTAIPNGSDATYGISVSRQLVDIPAGSHDHVITSATQANPVVITTADAHHFESYQEVSIDDVVGMAQLNGNRYFVNKLTTTTFSIYSDYDLSASVDGTGYTAYTSGGKTITTKVYADTRTSRSILPNWAPEGYYVYLSATDTTDGYWVKFSQTQDAWIEAANPYQNNAFDLTTMPHFLTRTADGSFTFGHGTYDAREAGDTQTVPNPDFVGKEIKQITTHRNRLVIVSGETVFFSRSRAFFNFWRQYSTQVLDSDPFGLQASSDDVNELVHAFPFRRSLFLSSDRSQFEVSSEQQVFTSKNAVIDTATAYITEPKCDPVALGNRMYFAAKSGRDALVFEYQYNDSSLSTTAEDITIHALGYIPAPIVHIAADSANEMMFCISDSERNSLYIYKTYTEQETKAQSAWSKWDFGTGTYIHWVGVILGDLYMYVTRGTETFIEKIVLRYELSDDKHPYQVCLDQTINVQGSYSSTTNLTTWASPYLHNNKVAVILSSDFPAGQVGERLALTYPTTTTMTAVGDHSAHVCILGTPFTQEIQLSKLFVRSDAAGKMTVQTGRFQLKRLQFNYQDTGLFKIEVTPESRPTQTFTFNGTVIGTSLVGGLGMEALGSFKVPVRTNANTVTIKIKNDSEKPMIITSIDYTGFFNELTRQE
tara:strand:- start:10097 stop:12751 length:2655 start_codon:yes stop_codon:yes gene_type:complete